MDEVSRPTTKYGIRVPSSDVAKCCVTVMFSASKNAGACLIDASGPPTVPDSSVAGTVKPLELRKNSSLSSGSTSITEVVVAGGTSSTGRSVHPSTPGVSTRTSVCTSRSTTVSRWLRVQAYCSSELCASGANSTVISREPARKSG